MNKFVTATFIFVLIASLSLIRCKTTGKNILPLTKSWEKAIPQQEIPQGLTSLSAKYCATCHLKHYQEWLLSTHAHAWSDLQFQSTRMAIAAIANKLSFCMLRPLVSTSSMIQRDSSTGVFFPINEEIELNIPIPYL